MFLRFAEHLALLGRSALVFLAALGCITASPALQNQNWERQTWQTENGLPQNSVHAIVQGQDGYIWIGTEGGMARFDGFRFQVFSSETNSAVPSNDVRALAVERGGGVWAATAGGVVRVERRTVKSFGVTDGLPSADVTRIFCDSQNRVIANTAGGAAMWNGKRFESIAFTPAMPRRIPEPMRFDADDPLTRAGILCQFSDREGNVWIGTDSQGLTVLRRTKFSVLGARQGLSQDAVRCVFARRDGSMWFGTGKAGLNRLDKGAVSQMGTPQGLSSDVVISLGEDANGDLAIGTPDGLNLLHGDRVTVLTSADGLADDLVRSISNDGETLFVGTRRGLSAMKSGEVRTYTQADGLGSDLVGATLSEGKGKLWIATLNGLSVLEHGKVRNYTTRDGLSSNVVTALYRDAEGLLWVGTQGGSLNCFRAGHFDHFNAGLPKVIYGISEDRNGSLWLASSVGVYRVNRHKLLEDQGEAVSYGTADGLRINECSGGGHPALARTDDGTLWFATPKGAASMTEQQARLNEKPPPVVIESLRVDDHDAAIEDRLTIGPGHSQFAFEYVGLSFVAPQKVHYRYRLEGFDKSWIEAGTRRVAYYTNLPAGNYKFRVLASNNDGIWNNTGAQMQLRLEPRFYQTLWFYCLCGLAAGLMVYGAYRWRVRQVARQYDAVLAERNRIAREIHDTLAQGFAGVSVQLEIISRLMEQSADAARTHINEARKLVRESLNEARRSIWELRSQATTVEDLPSRLSLLTHQGPGGSAGRVSLNVSGTLRPLAGKVESELLRIAEEAVRNARRHGGAQKIDLNLVFHEQAVCLTVADDGAGFDVQRHPGAKQGHFGLAGMRERAESIGAKFEVTSSADKGTVVTVEAPV